MKSVKHKFYILLVIFVPIILFGNNPVILEQGREEYHIGKHLYILEDKDGYLKFEDISSEKLNNQFISNISETPNFSYSDSTLWVRFDVENRFFEERTVYLELANNLFNVAEFYSVTDNGFKEHRRAGNYLPFSSREFNYRNFVFELKIIPKQKRTIYLKLRSSSIISIPLKIWSPKRFIDKVHIEIYLFGLYFGLFAAILLYNLFVFFSVKDKSYLLYVLYVLMFSFFQLSFYGFGYQYLWFDFPWMEKHSFMIFAPLSFLPGILFAISFLKTKYYFPKINKLLIPLIIMILATSVISLFNINRYLLVVTNMLFMIVLFPVLIAAIVVLRKGYRPAIFFVIGWSFLLTGILIGILGDLNVHSSEFIAQHAHTIGSFIEIIFLSYALAGRINIEKKEKMLAQEEALKNRMEAIGNLRKADKLKDQFLANTSHELKTPLTGIIGLTESIIDGAGGKVDSNAIYNLNIIKNSGMRLSTLINDILDFEKMKNREIDLKLGFVDLKDISNSVIALSKLLIAGKAIELINDIDESVPLAWADRDRLQQVLYNLIGNAIKFTEKGEIRVSAEEKNGKIHVTVSDTGIGIPKDKFDTIFSSFEQADSSIEREYGGTGIGLSITKKLVELHAGKIWLESEIGKGSTFIFTLEKSKTTPIPNAENKTHNGKYMGSTIPVKSAKPKLNTAVRYNEKNQIYTILTVDDEAVNQQVLLNHLSYANYNVNQVYGGKEALEALENGEKPDLILLDIMMPGMSGYDVCKKIREKYESAELPVVMLTAKNRSEDLVKGFKSGANDYLTKPFSKDELLARVRSHVDISEKVNAENETLREEVLEIKEVCRELKESSSLKRVEKGVAESILRKLDNIMKKEKLYRVESITIRRVAEKVGISSHDLTEVINNLLNENFYSYINSFRIIEVKERLSDPGEEGNILNIAIDAGFKAKSSFNTIFKKSTGMTPSQFRKKQKTNSK